MDYLHYMLTDGLIQVLGEENVILYPFKKAYAGGADDWYILDDGKTGFTSPIQQGKCWENLPELYINDIIKGLKSGEFEYIVLFSSRNYAVKALDELKLNLGDNTPVVFVDGEDYDTIQAEIIRRYSPVCYFKRELTADLRRYSIYPFPFSAITNNLPDVDDSIKDIDVFFSCGRTYPLREEVLRRLLRLKKERGISFVGGSDPTLPEQNTSFRLSCRDYHRHIARSKIGISVRGFGRDTLRRWEIPTWNTLHICDKLDIIIPDDFTDNENIVYFNTDNFEEKVIYYLENDDEREKIAKKGREHLMNFHTTAARAKYFLSVIQNRLKKPE